MVETEFTKSIVCFCKREQLNKTTNFSYSETTSRVKEFPKISLSTWSLWLFRLLFRLFRFEVSMVSAVPLVSFLWFRFGVSGFRSTEF